MTLAQFASFSNHAIAAGTVVLGLAFLAHVGELLFARSEALVPVGAPAELKVRRSHLSLRLGVTLTALAALVLAAGVITRAIAAQRVPWGNMYEFGTTGVTIALVVHLVAAYAWKSQWAGLFVSGFGLSVLGLAMTTYVPAGPLVPALHSYWLAIHVTAVMTAGGLFLIGASASVLYLIKSAMEARGKVGPALARFPQVALIDQLAYRVHAAGFVLWTFGALIAGPIWAQEAWGRYWGWDPKEVWAFITWVVFAGYLHARATAGWRGRRAAILALVGFATFLFSFYGVNMWVPGLHSYAK
jgi:cytochrome c-type biogenesis protein CcsB